MVVVGLVAHGEPPDITPNLEGVAQVALAVNGRSGSTPTPWLGFGANHNRLMDQYPDAEWYIALNADVDLSRQQLYTLLERADSHGYALVAPLRREPWGLQGQPTEPYPTPSYFLKATFPLQKLKRRSTPVTRAQDSMADAAWIGGCCMAIRGDLMRALHFDERYFMYFEDVDLGQRAHGLGAQVGVCTEVTIEHATGWKRDDPLMARRGVEYARSAIRYAEAHSHSPYTMRMAVLAWASALSLAPNREIAARAATRAIARALIPPSMPGLSELASLHNQRHGFNPEGNNTALLTSH
jgi:GT2 family glycosyltransferase